VARKKKLSFTNFIYGLLTGIVFGIISWLLIRYYYPQYYPKYSAIIIAIIFALIGGKYHKISMKLFSGIWFLIKNTFIGIKYLGIYIRKGFQHLVIFFKRKKEEIKEEKIEESRPVVKAQYEPLKIIEDLDGDYNKFENKLFGSSSLIGIILGARGTGKSAIGMKLLENIKAKTNRKVCAMGFKKATMPDWIKVVSNIEDIPIDSVVLIDEAGIEFSSRESMSNANKLLSSLLLIARHKDLTILFISQNSSNLEINIIRQADFLILKPSSLLQKDFERGKIKEIYSEAQSKFKQHKDVVGLTYIYSTEFRGFVTNSLPSFWNKDVSKAYR